MNKWKSNQDKQLPEFLVKSQAIQRQVRTKEEADSIDSISSTASNTSIFVSMIFSGVMMIFQFSIKSLWDAINSIQIIL